MRTLDLILLRETLLGALREDVGSGDITTRSTVSESSRATARYVAKQDLVVAGLPVVRELAALADPGLEFLASQQDGEFVSRGATLAVLRGSARSILTVERASLNFLQRLCGIATMTRRYVEAVRGTRARIIDTRKTAPGLRVLDKYAVACGGGMNHRVGLFDGVLIKNNHIAFHRSVADAVREARQHLGHRVKIEAEVRSVAELDSALDAGVDVVLLDNFTIDRTREAVERTGGRVPIESSGGITLETVRAFGAAGVDYISVGALTHSVTAADIHLRVEPE